MESSFTTASLSIETLMDETEPIVMEKYGLDYTDESPLFAFFNFWDHKDFDARIKMKQVSIRTKENWSATACKPLLNAVFGFLTSWGSKYDLFEQKILELYLYFLTRRN